MNLKKLIAPVAFGLTLSLFASPVLALTATNPGRLRSCAVREMAIKRRSDNLTRLAMMMETKFASHAARVETFYTMKLVPAGKTIPNYGALVADISTKKASVDAALVKANADVTAFSCADADPKGDLNKFRLDMQSVIRSLKDYRLSVRNLVVAVHSQTPDNDNDSDKNATRSGGRR